MAAQSSSPEQSAAPGKLRLGTWNCKIGKRTKDINERIQYCVNSGCDVIALQEITSNINRKPFDMQTKYNIHFLTRDAGSANESKDYLGFLVKKSLKFIPKKHSSRIASLKFEIDKVGIQLFNFYAPVLDTGNWTASKEASKKFYAELETICELEQLINPDRIQILCGDFNAFPKNENGQCRPWIMSHVYGKSNGNGENLLEFLRSFKVYHLNSRFEKKEKWTYRRSVEGKNKSEIDGFLSNRPDLVVDVDIVPNEKAGHRLVHSEWNITKNREVLVEKNRLLRSWEKYKTTFKNDGDDQDSKFIKQFVASIFLPPVTTSRLEELNTWESDLNGKFGQPNVAGHVSTNDINNFREFIEKEKQEEAETQKKSIDNILTLVLLIDAFEKANTPVHFVFFEFESYQEPLFSNSSPETSVENEPIIDGLHMNDSYYKLFASIKKKLKICDKEVVQAVNESNCGINIGGQNLSTLRWKNKFVLIDVMFESLKTRYDRLVEACKKHGLIIDDTNIRPFSNMHQFVGKSIHNWKNVNSVSDFRCSYYLKQENQLSDSLSDVRLEREKAHEIEKSHEFPEGKEKREDLFYNKWIPSLFYNCETWKPRKEELVSLQTRVNNFLHILKWSEAFDVSNYIAKRKIEWAQKADGVCRELLNEWTPKKIVKTEGRWKDDVLSMYKYHLENNFLSVINNTETLIAEMMKKKLLHVEYLFYVTPFRY